MKDKQIEHDKSTDVIYIKATEQEPVARTIEVLDLDDLKIRINVALNKKVLGVEII